MKKLFRKYRNIFEAYKDASIHNTFKGQLNYEAGKLFFVMLISMVIWLPYIPNDIILHQFPTLAIFIRLGLTLLSMILIALKFTERFRNRPDILLTIMTSYLNFSTAIVTAASGENAASYIGGFSFVLVISPFIPFPLNYKFIISTVSFATFFIVGLLVGLDFSDVAVRYAVNDLLAAYGLSLLASYILNQIKYISWQRQCKLLDVIEETMNMAAKVETASKAKSDFFAKMSHEIRTPMNAITGMAELALREKLPNIAREHVVTIKQAGANLLAIINDILDLSKIESGKMEIVSSDYQFSSLIHDVVSIIRMRAMDSNLKFIVNIDSNIPNALFGDETRIRQILLNVLSNAVKYTKEGFVSFSVNGEITEDNLLLTIDVTDSGRGIKPEDLEKLFGEFVQIDLVSHKDVEGTGLGLAITKNLVIAMGGDISVKSEYGSGSTFTIKLPQKIRSHEPFGVIEAPEKYSNESITVKFNAPRARILIVDDIDTNLKVASGLMLPYKMQVDLRLSGAEAIEAVKANNYDLVFMDHMMPEMDGIEATKRIREIYPELPIIALTANAVSGVKEMFLSNGFSDFLSKPIDIVKMNAILTNWIPKEKQEKATETTYESESNVDLEIAGVDVKKGIAMVGGTLKLYMEILSTFYKNSLTKINEIKKCLETDNYPLYTTYIHALKSASANIGALDLSEMARALESAGRQADIAYIKQHNSEFLSALEIVLDNINKVLKDEPKTPVDLEALKVELNTLKEAIGVFNAKAIDKATNSLQAFKQVPEVENILQKTLIGEYDEAVAMIESLAR